MTETFSFTDQAAIATKVLGLIATDSLVITDVSAGVLAGFEKSVTDTLSMTDTAAAQRLVNQIIADTLSLADTTAISTKTIGKIVTEILNFTDNVSAEGGIPILPEGSGRSMSLAQMRRLERLQVIQRDDEELLALLERMLR